MSTACERALAEGAAYERLYAPLLRQYGKASQFEFIRFSQVEQDLHFAGHHQTLLAMEKGDPAFRKSIYWAADIGRTLSLRGRSSCASCI